MLPQNADESAFVRLFPLIMIICILFCFLGEYNKYIYIIPQVDVETNNKKTIIYHKPRESFFDLQGK